MESLRLFIALPVPPAVKDLINGVIKESGDLFDGVSGFRFTSPENWHFTVSFLGDQREGELSVIKEAFIESVKAIPVLKISLERICYGPIGREPRMLWLTVNQETSVKLQNIKNIIEKNLIKRGINWQRDNRLLKGHLTIARFTQLDGVVPPNIEKAIKCDCEIDNVQLLKSNLFRTGAVYEVLSDLKLHKS